ncbi:hypothetical protein A6P39_002940 [Streptomyces sp. FXJ1.172]|uniref:hypothetical protein n=1 Tax=Streptomyces sp. FXJ1.172 TaxID=710705 RepID=UPI00082EA6CA|nr:hypothetical protein [Streptomyces sp. FXJ1.172]WEO93107.1 hypothetical protein A6P39_002940 [Streptomyces sp. FXJ1.172]
MRAVIAVAVLLLPMLGLLLYAMDRIEEGLRGRPRVAHHARGAHLRLVHSMGRLSADRGPAGRGPRHLDSA